jgi:hypothetical protein
MSKSAFYFSHDSNASQDPKILQMCSVYKAEGYGWYWMLIELMRDQGDYKLDISGKYAIDAFALRLYADASKLHSYIDDCVNDFHLFSRDKTYIWSESLLRRMGKMSNKSESARKAADVRWGKQSQNNADAMQTHSESNADASKIDAIKENKINNNKIKESVLSKKPYGEFKNVLLTDDNLAKLKEKFNSTYQEKIEELSEALKSKKGYSTKFTDHYATILSWARRKKEAKHEPDQYKYD